MTRTHEIVVVDYVSGMDLRDIFRNAGLCEKYDIYYINNVPHVSIDRYMSPNDEKYGCNYSHIYQYDSSEYTIIYDDNDRRYYVYSNKISILDHIVATCPDGIDVREYVADYGYIPDLQVPDDGDYCLIWCEPIREGVSGFLRTNCGDMFYFRTKEEAEAKIEKCDGIAHDIECNMWPVKF